MLSNGIFTTTELVTTRYTAEDLEKVTTNRQILGGRENAKIIANEDAEIIQSNKVAQRMVTVVQEKTGEPSEEIRAAFLTGAGWGIRLGLGLADVLLEKEAINEA